MSIKDIISSDLAAIVFSDDGGAVAAVFTDVSAGTTTDCFVHKEEISEDELSGYQSRVPVFHTVIEADFNDVGLPEEGKTGDTFTIDGEVFRVVRILEKDGFLSPLTVRMEVRREA